MLYKLLQNKYIPRVLYERCIKWLCSVVCKQGGVNRESRVRGLVRGRSGRWVSICGSVLKVGRWCMESMGMQNSEREGAE